MKLRMVFRSLMAAILRMAKRLAAPGTGPKFVLG
jgi:hypothetical protein